MYNRRTRAPREVYKTIAPPCVCQRTISTQKLKLLGKISEYDLYYSLTHSLK
jgi:hypothetical protein